LNLAGAGGLLWRYGGQRGVNGPDGTVGHRFAHEDAGRRIGDLLLDEAELGDAFAEGLAVAGVGDRVRERVLGAAETGRAELEAANVENVEGDVVAFARLAQQVGHGHPAIGENERAGGGAANAELVLLRPDGQARSVALDEKSGELCVRGIRISGIDDAGEEGEEVRDAGIGDPHFFAVEHIVLPVRRERGAGANVHGIGAGRGLGERVGGDPLAAGEARQIFLLLLFRAVPDERQRSNADVGAEGDREAGQPRDILGDDGRGDLIEREAAAVLGHIDAQQTKVASLAHEFAQQVEVLALEGNGDGQHFPFRKGCGGGGDLPLLGRKVFGDKDAFRAGVFEEKTTASGGGDCRSAELGHKRTSRANRLS